MTPAIPADLSVAPPSSAPVRLPLSPQARLMAGITLLTVPTIIYGGLTVLAFITRGSHGLVPAVHVELTAGQLALYRAGHAHAGVLVLLSLVLQVLLDATRLAQGARWVARGAAPAAAIFLSGGFFGIAHAPAFGALLWAGAAALATAVVVTGVGLVRREVE